MARRSARPNQSDIAEKLGVSISTVSRALANEPGVSEEVRQDVVRIARGLGYRVRQTGLAALDRRAVALVPLGSAASAMSSFYVGIVDGMRSEAARLGLGLEVRLVNEADVTLEIVQRYVAQAEAGSLLLAGIDPWDELVVWCREQGVSAVLVNGSDPLMRMSSVAPSNFYGAYLATQRLLDAGHRRILHFTHLLRPTILQRRRGFEAAVAAVPGAKGIVVSTAERTTAQLLEDLVADRHQVTAVFCWNDIAAAEMLESLNGAGRTLPAGFSIIGFDDMPIASMTRPRLSTMHVDRDAIGTAAVRLLQRHIEGDDVIQQVEIAVTPVAGATVHQLP